MLSKELEILRLIEELYHGDTTEQEMMDFAEKNQTKIQAWREAFAEYPLYEVTKAINHFYTKKSSKTRPNIAQITAILSANGVDKEPEPKSVETYQSDLDIRYMHEDVESGDCHHNLYYYTAALRKIRNGDIPWLRDEMMPSKADLTEVMERICEDRTGNKWEFLSRNDFISQGYDINKRYSIDLSEMFKKIN